MAKKKGPTDDEGILELGFEYDATGEQAAVKGAENVSKAIENVGKKAKKAGDTDLKTLEAGLLKVGSASNSVVDGQKKVNDALLSSVEKLKAQNATLRETVAQFDKLSKISYGDKINEKMAGASGLGLKVDKFAASPAVQSGMDYKKHLSNVKSVSSAIDKYTKKVITSTEAVEKKAAAEIKAISKMESTEQQLAAVVRLESSLASSVSSTSKTLASTSIVTANFSKNLEGLVKVTKDDDKAIKELKKSTAKAYNDFEASNRVLQQHKLILQDLKEKTTEYRVELKAKQELEKNIAKLTDEKQRLALLDAQNQRLAIAKAEFEAMSTAAEKYTNTLEAAARVGAKGYVPVATNVPYTPTGAELTGKLTDMGGNYAELKRVADARRENTAALIAEAKEHMDSASKTEDYAEKLKLTEMATEKLKEASLANKSALFDIGTLANQTGANLKTYTKYIQDNDTATLSLKNEVVDLSNQLIDSRDGLRAQSKGIMENITNLNTERKSIIENIKAQEELEKARLRTQASQAAMTQLRGMPVSISSVSSDLVARQVVNTSAMAHAKEFLAAADATNVYQDKLRNLDSAYDVINGAMKENKLAMASAKLAMEPLLAAYAEFKGDLDETDPKAKALKDTIEAMKKAYGNNMRAMREQGIEFESTRDNIVAEKKEWESLEKTARQASDNLKKKVAADAKIIEDNHNKIRSGLQNTVNMMRTVGMSLTRYVTAPLIAAGVQAVKFTAQMEMNIKSLEILLGNNAKAAERLYTQVTEYAAKTPYEIPDLTAATKQLLAFGSASGDIMEELRMLGDLAQNDADKLESVTSAFGKVQARGVAHMRELNRFIMAGVPIIQTLGKVLNKDSESLFKAVEAGQVGFDAIKQSIQLLTSEGERFYQMSEKLSQTVKGRWATLSDEVNLALKSFADDSMDSILRIINKVISLAEAIQTLAPSQRTAIKNWALMAVSLGPVLLGLTKILATAKNLFDIGAHLTLTGAKLGAMVGGPILAGVLAIVGVLGALYLKAKNITKEYEEQGKIINDMAVTFTRISANGGASKDVVAAYARELRDTVAPDVKVPVIMDIIMNEPDNARKELQALQELYNDYAVANKKLEQEKAKLVKYRPSEEEMANLSLLSERLKKEGYIFPKWVIKDATDAVAEVERLGKKIDDTIQEASTATTVMGWFKKKLGVTDADIPDVSTLLNAFKHNTEEAINGTLAQFERFYSIVPNIEGAKSAMTELRTVMSDALESETKTFSEKQFKGILEKSGVTEGTAAYTIMKFLLTPGEQGLAAAMDVFDEVFDKLPEFTKESIASFKKATEETFEKENLVEFWFSNKAFTDSPDLIAKRAKALSDMYTSIVESAASSILREKPSLSLQEALEMVKTSNAELFTEWENSLNTASVADAYSELAGLISSYSTQIAEVDTNEIEKFNNKVDALLEQLVDTDYYKKVKDSISGLKQDFATLKFDEVKKSLIDQKNALELTADAYYNLTQKNAGFDAAQRASLLTLKKYNDSLTNLKQLSDSLKSSAYGASFASAATDIKGIGMPKLPSLPTKFGKVSNLPSMEDVTVGGYRKGAIAAMAKELVDMDDATRKLTVSSAGYLEFMKVIPKAEWDAAVAVAYLAKASTQLATNQIDIASNGKDANDVQIEFWKGIKESVKNVVTPAQLKVIDELIGSFEKLKELGADAAGSAFIDAMADMREEINAFGRDAADTRAAEVLAKQKELLQAIAEDMGKSYSEVLTAFISGTDDEELRANITNAKNILSDFSTYLSNKALADITKTVKEYQKQFDQLGMSDEEKVLDDFRRQYTDAGKAVNEFEVTLLRYWYRMIEANDITKDVADEVENYAKQTAQLGMSEMGRAIDNIERQGRAAKWTSEQIQEVTDSARKYYALQASIEARKAATKKVEDFDALIAQKTMEGLLAGRDDMTVWLMQNAETIGTNTDLAISTYKVAKARIDAANAQESLTDTFDDYAKQVDQLGMSEREILEDNLRRTIALAELVEGTDEYNSAMLLLKKTLESFDKIKADEVLNDINDAISEYQKKTSQLGMSDRSIAIFDALEDNKDASPAKIKELTDAINKYYDAVEAREKRAATRDKADTFGETISDMYRDALLTGKDDMTVWLLDNAENILAYGEANNMSAGEAIKFAKAQYEQSKAIKESANNTMKLVEALQALSDMQKEVSETQYKPLSEVFGDLNAVTGATKFGAGNIDLQNRPVVDIGNGAVATINSFSKQFDNFEVLIPQVVDGMLLSVEDAIAHYLVSGEYLKKIDISNMSEGEIEKAREELSAYGEMLHKYEEYRLDFDNISGLIDSTVGESLAKSINERTEVDNQYLSSYKQYTDALSLIDEEVKNGLPKDEEFVKRMQALSTLVSILEQVEYSAKKVAEIKWTDLTKEIGTVGDVFFRNTREDMYDKIQTAGDEANIGQSEIDANKALYDKVENAKILKGVLDGIANTGFDSLISQLEEVGYAMSEGATWGEAFAGTMQNVVMAIINALPQLLMNAGLQLITAGQWHIGLPLLAAAGFAAYGKGRANGKVNGNKDGTTTPSNLNWSAKGDSFDRGRILNVPTVFNTASGLNIGGELGTEAILPLSRDSNGRLGVNVAGSGGGNTIAVPVTVNIVNQSGVETEAEVSETTNADGGKNIEVIIKRIVNKGMANGEYDRTMKSRYGLSNRGVS